MALETLGRRRGDWAAAAVAVFLACGGAEGASSLPGARVRSIQPPDSLVALGRPAAFAGTLPCEDCDGVDLLVVLHPDGSYRARELRRGAQQAIAPRVELGRWTLARDSITRLFLHGGGERRELRVASELTLQLVDTSPQGPLPEPVRYDLMRISAPPVVAGSLRARGRFREIADAPTFVACDGGTQFVIGGDSAYIQLQRAQASNALGRNAGLFVDVAGQLEDRPGMEEGTRAETVVVDSFDVVTPNAECEAAQVRALMAVGDWELTALDGDTLPTLETAVRPTLRFLMSDAHLTGSAGCNRFTGRAVLRGLDLVASPLVMTRRACADSTVMLRETRYVTALGEGGWFRVEGAALVYSRGGREVARFRRR